MTGEENPFERARRFYELAVFGGDSDALATADRELDRVEADLTLARGRLRHAHFLAERQEDVRELALFERAAELYQESSDARGEAEALFWVGTFLQVVREDSNAARPVLERSYELAAQAGDMLTLSYAARHLGFAEGEAGHMDRARERLEESLRLRREIGFMPGVAAALLALAELATREGRPHEALPLLEEAASTAEACGAYGILRWVEAARTELPPGTST